MSSRRKEIILLLIILAIASFFRLWQLGSIPPGLYPDVAMNGNNALESLKTLDFKVFYPDNNGREGLMMWLIAFSFLIFGISIWSIKIVSAVFGILTIWGLYLLTREVLRNTVYEIKDNTKYIALLSSFFLAISFWHVNFSRIGFRAILLPFVLVFGFYFLFRAFRQKKMLYSIISGIFFGLGFYTYISYRFIVLLLPIVLICWFSIYKRHREAKKFFSLAFFCLLFLIIVTLPIGIYFLQNPQDFAGRASPVSVFNAQNPLGELAKSFFAHLGMFNFYGDTNWRHNYATSPQLFWPVGIFFLIGIIFSIKELVLSIKKKNIYLSAVYCPLLSWFFIFLLPGILSYEGIPHSLRVVGVIPVVFIFAGLGAWRFYEFLENNVKNKQVCFFATLKNKKVLAFACFFLLFALASSEYSKYFILWGKNKNLEGAFTQTYADIGYFLNSVPEGVKKYVIVNEANSPLWGISIPAQTPMFIESTKYGFPQANYIKFEELDKINAYEDQIVIISLYDNEAVYNELSERFPWMEIFQSKGFKFYYLPD